MTQHPEAREQQPPGREPQSAGRERPQRRRRSSSTAELLGRLSQDTAALVRQEIELARSEMVQTARRSAAGAGLLGGAGVFGLLALHSGSLTLLRTLEAVLPPRRAAAVLTLGYGSAAGGLAVAGLQRLAAAGTPVPERAVESVKENLQWATSPTSSSSR